MSNVIEIDNEVFNQMYNKLKIKDNPLYIQLLEQVKSLENTDKIIECDYDTSFYKHKYGKFIFRLGANFQYFDEDEELWRDTAEEAIDEMILYFKDDIYFAIQQGEIEFTQESLQNTIDALLTYKLKD